uniref:Ig-like domain-containing protein n=1 Tax=Strongyloides venezuelensis TaxID=75913 RepID=A0A0K0FC28_STRVS
MIISIFVFFLLFKNTSLYILNSNTLESDISIENDKLKVDQQRCISMSRDNTHPKIVSVEEHSPAYLHCSITSNSNNIVAWTRLKDQTLLTAGAKSFTTDGRFQISPRSDNDWVLIIRRTELSDTGCYFCEINTEPNRVIEPVFLEIRPKRSLKQDSISSAAVVMVQKRQTTLSVGIEGSDIILNCTITGLAVGGDEVMWSKNDIPMDLTQVDKYFVMQQIHPSAMSHILRIYGGNKNDEGIYSCSGNNLPTAQHRVNLNSAKKNYFSKIYLFLISVKLLICFVVY